MKNHIDDIIVASALCMIGGGVWGLFRNIYLSSLVVGLCICILYVLGAALQKD